ncbi:hypothetical protein As57867_006346, partial [Aphanomyces stellatus]
VTSVHQCLLDIRPILHTLQTNTSALDALETALKSITEFYTNEIQQLKLSDCGVNNNCRWFRVSWNELATQLETMRDTADLMTVCFGAATAALLVCSLFASCFATRIQKPPIKVYVYVETETDK